MKKVTACFLLVCFSLLLIACDTNTDRYESAMRQIKGQYQLNAATDDLPVIFVPGDKPNEPEKSKPEDAPEVKADIIGKPAWPASFAAFPPFSGEGDYILYDMQEAESQKVLHIRSKGESKEVVAAYLKALYAAGFVDYGEGCYTRTDGDITYEFRSVNIWDGSTAQLYWYIYAETK